ncbi:MAG: tRNA pseudouridine(38-40) synthase TruA, partial [Duncaniella sp.]|nr:tRNA pseudouridine(38-40) synthase TruA [Duncaniella sp.]
MQLSYRGAPFHGWQCQPGEVTVQSVLEDALSMILRRAMKITGAGRTDAGVNARMMVAHFDLETPLDDPDGLVRKLNAVVGKDIAVQRIYEVAPDKHARFDAVSRTYHYYAVTEKTPFFYPLSWKAPVSLDFDAMNRAAEILLET